jgi:hypothetical protein
MLRWKSRYLPLLVSLALIAAAAANAVGGFFNFNW